MGGKGECRIIVYHPHIQSSSHATLKICAVAGTLRGMVNSSMVVLLTNSTISIPKTEQQCFDR
jgi:hypothetical protein